MGDVTAVMMDVITEKSGHQLVPNAVSVCTTPAAPSPLPIPYPVVASVGEGITDPPMRTKVNGCPIATTGSVLKTCHGNEPGTLKEVVSLNTTGPCFIIMGAPNVFCELGMMGITTSMCISNKAVTVGAGANASDASGTGGAGGSTNASGSSDANAGNNPNAANGGGGGDGTTNTGASASPPTAPNRYCPPRGHSAPPHLEADIDNSDLRLHRERLRGATPEQREAFQHATRGASGGRGSQSSMRGAGPQAFWSGSGLAAARGQGFSVQEDRGGAQGLDAQNTAGRMPAWNGPGVNGQDAWRTISRRSAEDARGTCDAFVVGTARPGNVFSSVELPTLLHNPNLSTINFRDPNHAPPPAPVAQTWNRNPNDGCWEGGPVPAGTGPGPQNSNPGFSLHPTQGFTRNPP
jgi:hypothetical protein